MLIQKCVTVEYNHTLCGSRKRYNARRTRVRTDDVHYQGIPYIQHLVGHLIIH